MSASFPNGTVFSVSTAFGTALALTAITNANPGVATTTTPPVDGTIGVIASGWPGINNRVVRSASAAATTFALEGLDTTSVVKYPAGAGAGTFTPASTTRAPVESVCTAIRSSGARRTYSSDSALARSFIPRSII